ncbi:hypothetical protein V1477_012535 [Vespula maculifrons]|uniref:Uncharacterized protein n=1 Tax=Vespula maculifrons TaxID=7453 RepID=A0ABD2BYC8_VESMC
MFFICMGISRKKQFFSTVLITKSPRDLKQIEIYRAASTIVKKKVKRSLQQSGQNDPTFVEQGLNKYPGIRLGYSRFEYTKIRAMRVLTE